MSAKVPSQILFSSLKLFVALAISLWVHRRLPLGRSAIVSCRGVEELQGFTLDKTGGLDCREFKRSLGGGGGAGREYKAPSETALLAGTAARCEESGDGDKFMAFSFSLLLSSMGRTDMICLGGSSSSFPGLVMLEADVQSRMT